MTIGDLFFLVSVLFVLILCIGIGISALRHRRETTRMLRRLLGGFVLVYVLMLLSFALALPRRVYAPGVRRCFDDWCASAVDAKVAEASSVRPCQGDADGRDWIATIEVSSEARRIHQRAPDARAELEDPQGKRYQPCASPLVDKSGRARLLSDELGPGESFSVLLPFRLPLKEQPVGLVVHHGDIPGIAIIGADQSLLHRPALQLFPDQR